MRIVTTTVARNEADVLEAFVRHHAGLVDRMVIVCHCCQDTSNELLRALQAEGLPLDVDAVDDPVFDQHCASTDLLEEAARRYDPEWILPLDADEFLVGDVVRATDGLSEERAALLAWKSYVLRPEDDRRETNVLRRIQYRVAESSGAKVMVPRVLRRRRRLGVGEGNHGVYERTTGARVPHARTSALALAHFPVRSEEQLRAKVLGGWPTRRAAGTFKSGSSAHIERLYEEFVDEGSLSRERCRDVAIDYALSPDRDGSIELVHDPIATTFDLRYPVEVVSADRVLGRTALALAAEVSMLERRSEQSLAKRLRRVPGQAVRAPRRALRALSS